MICNLHFYQQKFSRVNNYSLIISIAGFVGAIFLCSFFKFGITFAFFLIFLSVILLVYKKFLTADIGSNPSQIKSQFEPSEIENTFHRSGGAGQKIFFIAIFLFSFAVGVIRYEIADSKLLDINLENNINSKVQIIGTITEEPTRKDKQAILVVDFKNIVISSSTLAVSGKGIVSTDLYPELKYGDLINISGKLEKPQNISNIGTNATSTNAFDYVSYLEKDDINYQINFAKTELISSGNGNPIKSILFNFKDSFLSNLNKKIIEPEASLLGGILIGAKKSIDANTTEILRKSGLSYLVVVSGYNITVVADAIMKLLSFLPNIFGFLGGILGIICFVIMSGASSKAIRAGIMALIVILADITHRNYQAGRALIIAGLLMVIINPKILVFDLSFQLSFLATVAVIYISPIIKTKLIFLPAKFGLRDTISFIIAVQILVLPLILYSMETLSLVALPTSVLIIAFVPVVIFFGFVTGMFGFLWLPLSIPFAWISWVLLAYIFNVSKFFAGLPFSTINISWFSFVIMAVYYLFISIWIFYQNKKSYPVVSGKMVSK